MPRRAAALATPATSTPLTDPIHNPQLDDPFAAEVSLLRRQWKWAAFSQFFYHFGFFEAWREPEDEAKFPVANGMLPQSECNIERMERTDFAYTGTVDQVRQRLDAMVENIHPEWFVWQGDQGLLPIAEVRRQIETFGKELLPRYK